MHVVMYCNQEKRKNVITTKAQVVAATKKQTLGWAGELFASDIEAELLYGAAIATW